jgi:hypothetical protein
MIGVRGWAGGALLCLVLTRSSFVGRPSHRGGDFVLDESKYYVYLKFDHVGNRQPLFPGEIGRGLWLRLVNNCKLPIRVAVIDGDNKSAGISLYHDVIARVPAVPHVTFRGIAPAGSPDTNEPSQEQPLGYSLSLTNSTESIAAGNDVVFSVPANHVGRHWGIDVRFYLDFPGQIFGTGPYSVVSFDWRDIPQESRQAYF